MVKKEKGKIKAVMFDLGGVLIPYNHMIAARKMSKTINVPAKEIFHIINSNKGNFTSTYELGAPRKKYWGIMEKQLKLKRKIPYKKFDNIWNTIFHPNKKTISFIKKLKKNYKVALISNIGSLHKNHLEKKYKLNKLFSVRIYSYRIGSRKPKQKIFKEALKRLNIKPKESVFIDDRKENVRGAMKIGIHGILFRNNKQLFSDLKKLGVK